MANWFWNNKADVEEELRVVRTAPREVQQWRAEEDIDPSISRADQGEVSRWMERLKQAGQTKKGLYGLYNTMAEDSLIGAALSLVVQDVTKVDRFRNKVVWCEHAEDKDHVGDTSDEQDISDMINDFLKEIRIDEKIEGWVYDLLLYGEVFLKTYDEMFEKNNIPEQFEDRRGYIYEKVDKPEDMVALELFETLIGFGTQKRDANDQEAGYDVVGLKEYAYMCLDFKHRRKSMKLKFNENSGDATKLQACEFKAIEPTSYLEEARQAWVLIDLIENIIIQSRFNTSNCFNIIGVEVANAGRGEASKIIRSVKRMFENQDNLDLNKNQYYGYAKPVIKNGNVFVGTRNGKGEITVTPVVPPDEIKNAVDLDYFMDKLAAALRIPKAYLGLSDDNLTGLGNGSLTKISIVYCRLINQIQTAVCQGVTDIVNHWLKISDKEELCDNFEIKMSRAVSSEDQDWCEDAQMKLGMIDQLSMILQQCGIDPSQIIPSLLDSILGFNEFSDELDNIQDFVPQADDGTTDTPKAIDLDIPVNFDDNEEVANNNR